MSESLDKNISEYQSETSQLNPETLTNQQTIKYLQHIGTYLSGINDNIKETSSAIRHTIENTKSSLELQTFQIKVELEKTIVQQDANIKKIEDKIDIVKAELRSEIRESSLSTIKWCVGIMIACTVTIVCCIIGSIAVPILFK